MKALGTTYVSTSQRHGHFDGGQWYALLCADQVWLLLMKKISWLCRERVSQAAFERERGDSEGVDRIIRVDTRETCNDRSRLLKQHLLA